MKTQTLDDYSEFSSYCNKEVIPTTDQDKLQHHYTSARWAGAWIGLS